MFLANEELILVQMEVLQNVHVSNWSNWKSPSTKESRIQNKDVHLDASSLKMYPNHFTGGFFIVLVPDAH